MSSPGVKSVEKQKGLSKSPTHSTPERPPSQNKFSKPTMSTSEPDSPELFSWLRVFKLADLMTKQGC
nr:unknown unsecreted protein [Papilio xuthus]